MEPIFNSYEIQVMQKYVNRKVLSEQDRVVVDRLSLIGMFSRGFDFDNMQPTAKLTDLGRELLD